MNLSTRFRGFAMVAVLACFLLSTVNYSLAAPLPLMPGTTIVERYAPTSTASKIVTTNNSNTSVSITNIGSVTVYVGPTSAVTASAAAITDGAPILAGNNKTYNGMTGQLYAITASGTGEIRVEIIRGGGTISIERLQTSGISNGAANTTIPCSDGTNLVACNALIYNLSTAITANSTSTATAAGVFAVTSHATGRGLLFVSDGSLWQLANNQVAAASSSSVTIATTSTSDVYVQVPVTGVLTGVDFTSIDALAASDTNYVTWTLVNLGQSGVGATAMLAVSDANTTKTTGGVAITAVAKHALTVHGTAGNLVVVKGDILRLRATVTGTLAGQVTGSRCQIYVTRTA